MNAGHCPECKARIADVDIEHVNVRSSQTTFHGVSYLCPHCHCVLSVAIGLKSDTVAEVAAELENRLPD